MDALRNIRLLGRNGIDHICRIGQSTIFLFYVILAIPSVVVKPALLIKQLYAVGVLSIAIIVVSALNVGMVLGLQMYNTLSDFGAEQSLGQVVALALVRELGPVVAALLFAGRAGSAMTAELGLMGATEQLASMEMLAVDPVKRVVAPRFIAGILSLPLLTLMFSAIGIFGGYLVGVVLLGVDTGAFWSQMQANVNFTGDVLNGIIKSIVFAIAVTWLAVYEGMHAPSTIEGVSRATTRTVVYSAFAILALDFLLTALMFGGSS